MKKFFFLLLLPFILACSDDAKGEFYFRIVGAVEKDNVISLEIPNSATIITLTIESDVYWSISREDETENFWSFEESPNTEGWLNTISGKENSTIKIYFEPNLAKNNRIGHSFLYFNSVGLKIKEINFIQQGK